MVLAEVITLLPAEFSHPGDAANGEEACAQLLGPFGSKDASTLLRTRMSDTPGKGATETIQRNMKLRVACWNKRLSLDFLI
jgi:hypothetical protein